LPAIIRIYSHLLIFPIKAYMHHTFLQLPYLRAHCSESFHPIAHP
jgi:hypothetical protein